MRTDLKHCMTVIENSFLHKCSFVDLLMNIDILANTALNIVSNILPLG